MAPAGRFPPSISRTPGRPQTASVTLRKAWYACTKNVACMPHAPGVLGSVLMVERRLDVRTMQKSAWSTFVDAPDVFMTHAGDAVHSTSKEKDTRRTVRRLPRMTWLTSIARAAGKVPAREFRLSMARSNGRHTVTCAPWTV